MANPFSGYNSNATPGFDYNLENDKVTRRKKIAAILKDQVMGNERGQFISNGVGTFYAPSSDEGFAGAAKKIGLALMARYGDKKADKAATELSGKADAAYVADLLRLSQIGQPSAEPVEGTDTGYVAPEEVQTFAVDGPPEAIIEQNPIQQPPAPVPAPTQSAPIRPGSAQAAMATHSSGVPKPMPQVPPQVAPAPGGGPNAQAWADIQNSPMFKQMAANALRGQPAAAPQAPAPVAPPQPPAPAPSNAVPMGPRQMPDITLAQPTAGAPGPVSAQAAARALGAPAPTPAPAQPATNPMVERLTLLGQMMKHGPQAEAYANAAMSSQFKNDDRYTITADGNGGFIRLDKVSGEVTPYNAGTGGKVLETKDTPQGLMERTAEGWRPAKMADGSPVIGEAAAAANKEQTQARSGFENSDAMLQNAIDTLTQVSQGGAIEDTAGMGWDGMKRNVPGTDEYNTKFNTEQALAKNLMSAIMALKQSGVGTSAFNSDKEAERLEMAAGKINWADEKQARAQVNQILSEIKDTQTRLRSAHEQMSATAPNIGAPRQPGSGPGAKLSISDF